MAAMHVRLLLAFLPAVLALAARYPLIYTFFATYLPLHPALPAIVITLLGGGIAWYYKKWFLIGFYTWLLLAMINPYAAGKYLLIRILLLLMGWFFFLFYIAQLAKPEKVQKRKNINNNLLVLGLSIITIATMVEAVCLFLVQSGGSHLSFANQAWFANYWQLNSFGYRDPEYTTDYLKNRKKILVLGDSFTAGQGICQVKDRFTDRLAAHLGEEYRVLNAGVLAADTQEELARLENWPFEVQAVILAYVGNDIENAAIAAGIDRPSWHLWHQKYCIIDGLIHGSYFLNWLYWQLPQPGFGEDYDRYLIRAYSNPRFLNPHLADLQKIATVCKLKNLPLIILIFPFLEAPETSNRLYAEPITKMMNAQGIRVINLATAVANLPIDMRIVSSSDRHPGIHIHQLAADSLTAVFKEYLQKGNIFISK